MKRDLDLIREILLAVEDFPDCVDRRSIKNLPISEKHDESLLQYHLLLLREAGLIDAWELKSQASIPDIRPIRLTWAGHEFLDAARDKNRWQEARKVAQSVGGMTLSGVKDILVNIASNAAIADLQGGG